MKRTILTNSLFALAGFSTLVLTADGQERSRAVVKRTDLSGYNEVASLSTPARGELTVYISDASATIYYELAYSGFETPVAQAHLHLGQQHTNGGVSVFLCTNLGNGPAGTPLCPETSGMVNGTLTSAEVLGPAGQGISAGEIGELIDAIRAKTVYVNVHSQAVPSGEIRGQL